MINRRRFLGYSIAGALTAATGCRPDNFYNLSGQANNFPNAVPLLKYKADLGANKQFFLGYPINMNTPPESFFKWRERLGNAGINTYTFNNVGNPFGQSTIPNHTHEFEREVILRFAKVYGFSPGDTWGFLSHSGTDSNMHGMYMGRTLLKGRCQVVPKCYFTKEAHYSIQILSDVLGLESVFVDTLSDAGMDPEDLKRKLSQFPDHPALVVATIGTTFKGAIDHVDKINKVLRAFESYLHLDAALFGGYLPHTNGFGEVLHKEKNGTFDKRYDSIAVSCHKFFGFPSPAGLFITTQAGFDEFNEFYSQVHNPEYIGHVPGTITCSRDAVKPAEFYFFSTPAAMTRQKEDTQRVMAHTTNLLDQLETYFSHLYPQRSNELSNTLYFTSPSRSVLDKYSLATMRLKFNGVIQDFAHVVIMPHVNKGVIDEFLADLDQDRKSAIG